MMIMKSIKVMILSILLPGALMAGDKETLPPLNEGIAPQNFTELWAGFDPRVEPLETEVIKKWDEDGVVLRIIRFRIGIFKGQKALMAAVYGFPEGGANLPGLVQIHGGGQYADYRAVLTNAKRGYATISIAWAGRINAPGYMVDPKIVKLFWDGKTDDPDYKLTTDWGALDGYHAPCRNPGNAFPKIAPESWTLDPVESPRNSSWFLCALGARRALTFLERQPEVDPEKLGVYGHSMGGKLTVMTTAADSRVKAAALSCGGISDRDSDYELFRATLGDDVSLEHISCPIMFLSPSNDFHGRIDDLQKAVREIKSRHWRVTCSAHHNHQDTAEYEVAGLLWFDQYLKGTFEYPKTPESSFALRTDSGVPSFMVKPDDSQPILSVDIYYTRQGQRQGENRDRENTMNRFWHHAAAARAGNTWTAELPLFDTDRPLWVYANVLYKLDQPVTGAGYYYRFYTAENFNLSSLMHMATPDELKAAGVKDTVRPSLMIEAFAEGWEKEWFTYKPEEWGRSTHKVYDDKWKAPPAARLAFEVQAEKPNTMVVGIDKYAAEIELEGRRTWQQVVLSPDDFRNASGRQMTDWEGMMELRLTARDSIRERINGENKTTIYGAPWKGPDPQFRNLRWIEDSETVND